MAEQAVDVAPDASSQHLHNGLDTSLPPVNLHGSYINNRPLPPEGIADRHAYMSAVESWPDARLFLIP